MEVYEGSELTPPRVSLLSAAQIVPVSGERWYSGFDLINEGCEETGVFLVCPPEDAEPREYTATGENEEYQPWVLYATDRCSTFPARREFFDRAQRKLLAAESTVLEEQLWTGSVQSGNPFFADTSPGTPTVALSGTAANAVEALALLEQRLAETSATQGMIHVRPLYLASLIDGGAVRREGNVYLSPMDNIVVPGRGYPGTGPTGQAVGATEWMFAHPKVVQIRRGPVIRLGEDPATNSTLAQTIERFTNDRLVIVQRVVHVALDTSCGVFAQEFTAIAASE